MKDKTIDYVLRAKCQAVSRIYNEEANKYGASMATGFVLWSINKEKGTPSTALVPKFEWKSTIVQKSSNPRMNATF